MGSYNIIEIISIVIGTVALGISIHSFIVRKKLNYHLEQKIVESQLEKTVEKMISIRNANAHNKERRLSEKEILSIINRIEQLTKQLKEQERKHFEKTWVLKNQKDKLNYILKLINDSNDSKEFKRIEKTN